MRRGGRGRGRGWGRTVGPEPVEGLQVAYQESPLYPERSAVDTPEFRMFSDQELELLEIDEKFIETMKLSPFRLEISLPKDGALATFFQDLSIHAEVEKYSDKYKSKDHLVKKSLTSVYADLSFFPEEIHQVKDPSKKTVSTRIAKNTFKLKRFEELEKAEAAEGKKDKDDDENEVVEEEYDEEQEEEEDDYQVDHYMDEDDGGNDSDGDSQQSEISNNPEFIELLLNVLNVIEDGRESFSVTAFDCAATAARIIAETAKSDFAREPLADCGAFDKLSKLLASGGRRLEAELEDGPLTEANDRLVIQILRAIANLCYENEANRDKVLEAGGGIRAATRCLKSRNPSVLHTAVGCLLNASMDNEPVQLEVLDAGGMDLLLRVIELGADLEYTFLLPAALRTLSNLVEIDQGITNLLQTDGLSQLFFVFRENHKIIIAPSVTDDEFYGSLEILEALTTVFETIGENDTVQRHIVKLNLLNILLDFVDHRPLIEIVPQEDEDAANYDDVRKNISRIVTLVTMNDANMTDIPKHEDVIQRFKNWMLLGLGTGNEAEEDEIRMSGALCIGNLARSDETCAMLVKEYDVGQALLDLLVLEKKRVLAAGVKEETKSSIKVLHAVVGALKNLSIAAADRRILGEIGVIGEVADLFQIDGVKPVQFGCVGVIKNLCAGSNELNAYRVVTGREPPKGETRIAKLDYSPLPRVRTPLSKLINLIWKATGDNLAGIRNEGARAIVNTVRTCHLAGAPHLIKSIVDSNGIVPLIQILTGALLTRARTTEGEPADADDRSHEPSSPNAGDHHVHFDALPAEGQVYSLVQNEGLVALILICNSCPDAIPLITRYHASLIPTVVTILSSNVPNVPTPSSSSSSDPSDPASDIEAAVRTNGDKKLEYSDAVKVNVCLLLGALTVSDETFRGRVRDALQPILGPLMRWTSESNLEAATAVSEAATASIVTNVPASPPPPVALSRTGTKSARNVMTQALAGRVPRVEIAPGQGITPGTSAEEGLMLSEAVRRLMAVLGS